jgi:hypothetical protein
MLSLSGQGKCLLHPGGQGKSVTWPNRSMAQSGYSVANQDPR